MGCLPFHADERLKLARLEMDHQINGPLALKFAHPLLIVSPWNQPTYEDIIQSSDTWFVSDRLKALIEEAGETDVEFFPAVIENYDRKRSKLRPKVTIHDMSPGNAGGGSLVEGYWWMNLWAQEDLLDREASIGQWHDGGRQLVRNNLDGKAGVDSLGRDPALGRKVVLRAPPSKPIFHLRGLHRFLFVSRRFAATLESHGVDVRVTAFRPSD